MGVGVVLAVPRSREWLVGIAAMVWTGDTPSRRRRLAMERLDFIQDNVDAVAELTTEASTSATSAWEAASRVDVRAIVEEAARRRSGAPAGSGGGTKLKPGDRECGYYHFDSTGRRFKTKWDNFDVAAELRRVDGSTAATPGSSGSEARDAVPDSEAGASQVEGEAEASPPQRVPLTPHELQVAAKRSKEWSKCETALRLLMVRERECEKVLEQLDQVRGDSDVKARRKSMVGAVQVCLDGLDNVRAKLRKRQRDIEAGVAACAADLGHTAD